MQIDPLKRREFITLLGGAAVAWPLAARAQQTNKLPKIGFLGSGTAAAQGQWVAAFSQRLRELGWIEGRNLTIEYRWAEGNSDRAADAPPRLGLMSPNHLLLPPIFRLCGVVFHRTDALEEDWVAIAVHLWRAFNRFIMGRPSYRGWEPARGGSMHKQPNILTIVDLAVEAELRNIFEEIATGKTATGSRQVAARGFPPCQ
jgi:hypothetical protein